MRAFSTLTSLLALSSLLVLPSLAHAEKECSTDSDCAKGWTCHESGTSDCATPACPPGEKCEAQPTDCAATTYKTCQPMPCHADSECADGMICYTFTSTRCAASDCAPGQTCPNSCTTEMQSACAPRYVVPCNTASDCGSGFSCESNENCECSGSGSAPATPGNGASAGSASTPEPEPPSCSCEQSKDKSCHTQPVNCTADSDCLTGWTCATFTTSYPCASGASDPASGAGAQGGATPAPAPDCPAPTEIKQCAPPYYSLIGDSRGISHDPLGAPTTATSGSDTPHEASGAAIPPTFNNADDKGTSGDSTSSAGCSVTPGARTTGSALALFGVLGLFTVLRRRRAH
ncbi:MAG TPA: MYXO-CTERM sorting domain-containing protein [Polyangiaceae bacterium]|nr:MYXO-CTERM sorting domain-containing protein [Polyangiaceae bacterium]